MELKPGYRQTEIGVIPEDWEVKRFGELTSPGHSRIDPSRCDPHEFCVELEHIDQGRGSLIGWSVTTPRSSLKSIFDSGDVLFGKLRAYLRKYWLANREGVCSTEIWVLRPNEDVVTSGYLFQIVQMDWFIKAASTAYGTHMPRSDWEVVKELELRMPPVSEQNFIATALSDADALLDSLDRLIAKKRDLKQAAMQQLLTGETRLPGFNDKWKITRLGNYVTFLRNGVNSRAELIPEGQIKYLHYGDIHASKDIYISTVSLPYLPDTKAKSLDRLQEGDLIFVDASEDIAGVSKSVEVRGVGSEEFVSGLHTIAARFDKKVLADGFKGFLQFCPPLVNQLRRLAAGTKVYATNRAHIADVELPLPSIPEQTAIARVLSDMDAEIFALEQHRNKTKDIKQAMMQELLTGKTRLVTPGGSNA